jgi:hypothetical protein
MSDSSSSDQSANSTGSGGDSAAPRTADLPQIESPTLAPDQPEPLVAEAAKAEPVPNAGHASDPAGGTAPVLARPQTEAAAPAADTSSGKSSAQASPLLGFRRLAAMMAAAAALGGLAGSLATAGLSTMTASPPSYYSAFAEALGRIDHELTQLKAEIDGSAKASSEQVARLAERMDRAEKARAEAGAKLAKATDALDRMERRFPASATGSAGDVTGAIAEPHAAAGAAMSGDGRRNIPGAAGATMPIVEGWVLRDVYRGAAMLQGRGGIIEVVPGDHLPALGRIEALQRQDGRWVVVTSRGLIVSR